ncbi:protoporphyrinogen/coproporphyrinogen oxidase [Microbacterium sp.]|uniref:protoporphyrinogen/coproporphyrinogen oxidase n=1 Tax=Microbacterium sp. TaxID=51671 RepID=UPI0039E674CC
MPDPTDLISRAQGTRVVVIGGSVAGLVAALECAKVGMEVTLLEATDRLGGEVESVDLDGVRVDVMVDTFAAGGATLRALVRDLGLESRLAPAVEPVRAVSGADGVHLLPAATVLGIPANAWDPAVRCIIGWRGVWRAYLDRLRPPLTIGHQRNLGALVRARMGDRVAERMVAPVTRGVLGLEPDRVDVEAVAPGLGTALTRTGSLAGAVDALDREGTRETLEGGVAALVDALVDALTAYAVPVRRDAPVTELARDGDRWRILVDAPDAAASGDAAGDVEADEVAADPSTSVLRADVIVMASGAPDARRLLSDEIELPALASATAHDVVLLRGDLPLAPGQQVFPRGSAGAVLVEGIAVPEHSRTAASEGIARVVLTGSGRAEIDAIADALHALAEAVSRPVPPDAVSVAVHRSVVRTARGELDQRPRTDDVRAASRSVPALAFVGAAIVGGDLRDVVEDAVTEIGRVRRAALWGDDAVAVDDAGSSGSPAGAS